MTDNSQKPLDRTLEILTDLIDSVFSKHYNKEVQSNSDTPVYECIEDYVSQTGKRFRMTKEQKDRSMSREEAFNETFGGSK